jgi:hypothetical protein
VPVVWLQRHLWHGGAHLRWYDYASFAVYVSHFFLTPLIAATLWLWAPRLFRRYVAMVMTLALLGLATYASFPAVPPWLASRDHFLPPIARIAPVVAAHVPGFNYGALFETSARSANDVAAIPSLHAGYAMLAALFLSAAAKRRSVRLALLLYPWRWPSRSSTRASTTRSTSCSGGSTPAPPTVSRTPLPDSGSSSAERRRVGPPLVATDTGDPQ